MRNVMAEFIVNKKSVTSRMALMRNVSFAQPNCIIVISVSGNMHITKASTIVKSIRVMLVFDLIEFFLILMPYTTFRIRKFKQMSKMRGMKARANAIKYLQYLLNMLRFKWVSAILTMVLLAFASYSLTGAIHFFFEFKVSQFLF